MSRTRPPRTSIERLGAKQARDVRRSIASEIERARQDAGLSARRLAAAAGISHASLLTIERGSHDPTTEVVARLAAALGMSLNVRLFPGTGPLIRDRHQSAMLGSLIGILHARWRRRPEVAVYRPVRGVVDLVLDADDEPVVACEAESELRRIEQQVRWAGAKADALASAREGDDGTPGRLVGRLLLLRSTTRNRAVVAQYAEVVAAAYPARAIDATPPLLAGAPGPATRSSGAVSRTGRPSSWTDRPGASAWGADAPGTPTAPGRRLAGGLGQGCEGEETPLTACGQGPDHSADMTRATAGL